MAIIAPYKPMRLEPVVMLLRELRTAQIELQGRLAASNMRPAEKRIALETMTRHCDALGNAIELLNVLEITLIEVRAELDKRKLLVPEGWQDHAFIHNLLAALNRASGASEVKPLMVGGKSKAQLQQEATDRVLHGDTDKA